MKTLTQLAASIERRMQEFTAVDLGKSNGYGGCCDMPSPSPSYPTLYVSGREDSKLSDIPAKGKAVIEYRLRSKTVNYGQDGKESHSSDIEVQSIDPQTHLEAALERHELALQEVPDGYEVQKKRGVVGKVIRGGLMLAGAGAMAGAGANALVKRASQGAGYKAWKSKRLLGNAANAATATGLEAILARHELGDDGFKPSARLLRIAKADASADTGDLRPLMRVQQDINQIYDASKRGVLPWGEKAKARKAAKREVAWLKAARESSLDKKYAALEAALARHELGRGDQLASMIGAKVVPLRKGDKLASDLAGRMRKVRSIDKVKKPALRGALEPNRQKILKGMRGDLKHVKAVREADFKEAREIWDGSIGTRLPRGAVKDGRRAYGLEAKRLARVLDAMAVEHEFGRNVGQLMKTRGPLKITRKVDTDEFLVHPRGGPKEAVGTYYTNDIRDARGTMADLLRRKRKGQSFARGDVLQKVGKRFIADQPSFKIIPDDYRIKIPRRGSVKGVRAAEWLRSNKSPARSAIWASQPLEKLPPGSHSMRGPARNVSVPGGYVDWAPAKKFESALARHDFGSAGYRRLRRVEEAMMKKLKGAGADTGKFNRTMRPLWKKQEAKFEGSFQKSMKRPDFGLRQTSKLRDASDAISHRPDRRLPLAGPDDYKPRVLKTVPAIKGVAGTGPQWSASQKKFESALARHEFGDRARNPAGQYSSGYEVSTDDMADAYGAKRKKKAALLVGAGGATVAAAMAGRKYAPQMARSVGPAIGRVLRSAVM